VGASVVASLRDFLVDPSPMLNKLHRYMTAEQTAKGGTLSITVSTEDNKTYSQVTTDQPKSKLVIIFENLRDGAIENICRYITPLPYPTSLTALTGTTSGCISFSVIG